MKVRILKDSYYNAYKSRYENLYSIEVQKRVWWNFFRYTWCVPKEINTGHFASNVVYTEEEAIRVANHLYEIVNHKNVTEIIKVLE
jgi:hypothetical protein